MVVGGGKIKTKVDISGFSNKRMSYEIRDNFSFPHPIFIISYIISLPLNNIFTINNKTKFVFVVMHMLRKRA